MTDVWKNQSRVANSAEVKVEKVSGLGSGEEVK